MAHLCPAQVTKNQPDSDVDHEDAGGWSDPDDGSDEEQQIDSGGDEDGEEGASQAPRGKSSSKGAAGSTTVQKRGKGVTCGLCGKSEKDRGHPCSPFHQFSFPRSVPNEF